MSELKGVYGFVIHTIAGVYIIGRSLFSMSMTILRFIFPFFVLSSTGVLLVYFFTNVPKNQVAVVAAIPLTSLLILEKIINLLPIPQQPNQGNMSLVASTSLYVLGLFFVLSALLVFVPFLSYFLYELVHLNYLLPICSLAGLSLLTLSIVSFALMVIETVRKTRAQTSRSLSSILLDLTRTYVLISRHIFGSIFGEGIQLVLGVKS
jgi:hypothetical protein